MSQGSIGGACWEHNIVTGLRCRLPYGHTGEHNAALFVNETGQVLELVLKEDARGVKDDSAKLPVELLPYDALLEVVKVLQFGAKKYAPRNWEKGIPVSRVFAAAMRHAWALFNGEDNDVETGLSHAAHLACESLFWLAFVIRKTPNTDDRPKP